MQALTLIHSRSFPIGRYADALRRESILPRAFDRLDQLTRDNGSLRVILVDSVLGGNGADGSPHSAHLPLGRMVAAAPNLARPVDNESRDLGELFN